MQAEKIYVTTHINVFFLRRKNNSLIEEKSPGRIFFQGFHTLFCPFCTVARALLKLPADISSSSSIQTLLSAPEFPRILRKDHRIMPRQLKLTQARGLYHRLGLSPDPEELLPY